MSRIWYHNLIVSTCKLVWGGALELSGVNIRRLCKTFTLKKTLALLWFYLDAPFWHCENLKVIGAGILWSDVSYGIVYTCEFIN